MVTANPTNAAESTGRQADPYREAVTPWWIQGEFWPAGRIWIPRLCAPIAAQSSSDRGFDAGWIGKIQKQAKNNLFSLRSKPECRLESTHKKLAFRQSHQVTENKQVTQNKATASDK